MSTDRYTLFVAVPTGLMLGRYRDPLIEVDLFRVGTLTTETEDEGAEAVQVYEFIPADRLGEATH